jgi:hypothetical protein
MGARLDRAAGCVQRARHVATAAFLKVVPVMWVQDALVMVDKSLVFALVL